MRRLTDEQRERVAELVPLAKRLARRWARARRIPQRWHDCVESAFLVGLMVAVQTYDPARGTLLTSHVFNKAPRAAVDEMRRQFGREGDERSRGERRTHCAALRGEQTFLSPHAGPEDEASLRDTVAGVRRNLPAHHAHALLETVVGERSIEDVARELGVNQSRASQLRFEAVELLRMGGFMRRATA